MIKAINQNGNALENTDHILKSDPEIKKEKVTGEIYSDIWLDVGTKDRLEHANKILREEN